MREKREREKKLPKPNCTYIMHVPYQLPLSESKNIKCKNYNEKNKTLKSRIRDFLV
jgi:hypothetical protein